MAKTKYAPGRYAPPSKNRGALMTRPYMSASITQDVKVPWVGALGAIGAIVGLSTLLTDVPSVSTSKLAGTAAALFGGYVFLKDFDLI